MTYGLPYMGSKSRLIKKLGPIFPAAENFYDLFGGGGSVTHYISSKRARDFKGIHYNEIDGNVCKLFQDALAGKYSYDRFLPEWVSRDEFNARKNSDGYIQQIWSFGNNGRDYLFSKELEPYKRSMHQAVVFCYFDRLAREVLGISKWPKDIPGIKERRLYLRAKIEGYRKSGIPIVLHQFLSKQQLQKLKRLEQLERLEQLQQLERLQRLEQIEQPLISISNLDYRQIIFKPNSTIYCDPPYEGTCDYKMSKFDKEEFLDWAHSQQNTVYISEYNIDDPRFYLVAEFELNSTLCATSNSKKCIERLYCNKVQIARGKQLQLFQS